MLSILLWVVYLTLTFVCVFYLRVVNHVSIKDPHYKVWALSYCILNRTAFRSINTYVQTHITITLLIHTITSTQVIRLNTQYSNVMQPFLLLVYIAYNDISIVSILRWPELPLVGERASNQLDLHKYWGDVWTPPTPPCFSSRYSP